MKKSILVKQTVIDPRSQVCPGRILEFLGQSIHDGRVYFALRRALLGQKSVAFHYMLSQPLEILIQAGKNLSRAVQARLFVDDVQEVLDPIPAECREAGC